MDSTQHSDQSRLKGMQVGEQTSVQIAGVVIDKIWDAQDAIGSGALGHHQIKPSFVHHDGTPMTDEDARDLQCAHITSIGNYLGEEFLRRTPGVLLEQFATVAGNQSIPDSGAMLHGLLNGFMVAFATKETEGRALKAMLEIARIGNEANDIRGTSFGLVEES